MTKVKKREPGAACVRECFFSISNRIRNIFQKMEAGIAEGEYGVYLSDDVEVSPKLKEAEILNGEKIK